MIRITSFVLLASIVCLCLASRVPFRDPQYWNSWNNIDLLNEYMSGFNFGSKQLQSDNYLNELAQAVADLDNNQHEYINSLPKPKNQNVLVFGLKLKGNTTYKEILTENFNSVMDGMPGFLNLRYKNNILNVELRELKELMDITSCDTLSVPLICNQKAANNLWNAGIGEFRFQNDNYKYRVRFNNMLKVFEAMSDDRLDRYSLDIFNQTDYSGTYRNDNYEMNVEIPNFFGPGFWSSNGTSGAWGMGDQVVSILTHGGNIKATSKVQHQYLKVNLEINEPFVKAEKPKKRLDDGEVRDVFDSHFKTMYEMFDREQVFNSLTKYGEGYSLDSENNINIVFALSGPVNDNVRTLNRTHRMSLFNRLKKWPWFAPAPSTRNPNPFNKTTMIDVWTRALALSMGPINQDRLADGLPELAQDQSLSLSKIAQAAADRMALAGKFVQPDFSSARPNTLLVAMKLSGETQINEFSFVLNEHNFGQVTCFDNFSNVRHRVVNLIDNERYACSKNNKNRKNIENWKKYSIYGTGHAFNENGDAFSVIALSF